jgi:hypothetical protein
MTRLGRLLNARTSGVRVLLVATIALLLGCSSAPPAVRSPDFKERLASLKTVRLEPPEVRIRVGASRDDATRQPDEETAASGPGS